MRFLRAFILMLGILGVFGCYTIQVKKPVNRREIQQHSNQNMNEMQKAQKQQQE